MSAEKHNHSWDHIFTALLFWHPSPVFEHDRIRVEIHPGLSDEKHLAELPSGEKVEYTPVTVFHVHNKDTGEFERFEGADLPKKPGFKEITQQ